MKIRTTITTIAVAATHLAVTAQFITPVCQMERLDRGVVAVNTAETGNFISWRLLGTDDKNATTFSLLRDGKMAAEGLKVTNYSDLQGTPASQYQVVTRVNGVATDTSAIATPWQQDCLPLRLNRPEGGIHQAWQGRGDLPYQYFPNDMSTGDVDGDGQYELIMKWEPSHAQDNSFSNGHTGSTIIDCYKIVPGETRDGITTNCRQLWRVNLGPNIRSGAHYTPFMVYDFDGDGRAELMCKTATGSVDGTGRYVNQAATDAAILSHDNTEDHRNSGGHILSGAEYLTVFDGTTGRAIHTTWYLPGRAGTGAQLPSGKAAMEGGCELGKVSDYPQNFWGDNKGNRSERYLAAVAYINGSDRNACGIFCRGYYTQAYVWAVSFDGNRLHTEWLHASPSPTLSLVFTRHASPSAKGVKINVDGDVLLRTSPKTAAPNTSGVKAGDANRKGAGSNTLYANGNHNMSVADVDGDGCDEILWGSGALDNDGSLLYATGYGHGDAMHVGKLIPQRKGLQVFDVHEDELNAVHGCWDLHDAATGEILLHGGAAGVDNGRGLAADLTGRDGYEFWSIADRFPRSAANGNTVISEGCAINFRIYWDGSLQDQLFDGTFRNRRPGAIITKWNGNSFDTVHYFSPTDSGAPQTVNGSKSTPCLQADILGDWREELVLRNQQDPSEVLLFTTSIPTSYAVPTLMHDHTYRMGICWQNTAYNQPPHLGYYLPDIK